MEEGEALDIGDGIEGMAWRALVRPRLRAYYDCCGNSKRFFTAVPLSFLHAPQPSPTPAGEGQPKTGVVIVHGLLGSKSNWSAIAKSLSRKANCDVFAVDLRGHGSSQHAEISWQAMASDLRKFLSDISDEHGIAKPVLVGHSLGGRVAMNYVLTEGVHNGSGGSELGHVVMVDVAPSSKPPPTTLDFEKVFTVMRSIDQSKRSQTKESIRSLFASCIRHKATNDDKIVNDKVVDFLMTNVKSDGFRVDTQALHKFLPDLCSFLPKQEGAQATIPATFIVGEHSPYVTEEDAPAMARFFPDHTVHSLNAGHWVHSDQPREVIKILAATVQQTRASSFTL